MALIILDARSNEGGRVFEPVRRLFRLRQTAK